MSKTNNPGIDYSLGKANVDTATGIHYGVISCNACNPDALEDIYSHGIDIDFQEHLDQVKANLRSALSDYFSDHHWHNTDDGTKEPSKLDDAVTDAFEAISDRLGDQYESGGDCTRYLYESDGYKLQIDSSGDLWVLKSPYFTRAQFCSPCAPGAGYLTSPCDEGPKTYCLAADWFDDDKAPYPIYSVETGKPI